MTPNSLEGSEPFLSGLGIVTRREPRALFFPEDSIPFHATRLVLLISLAGRPIANPRIEGRTKLAKMDFFLRYPAFLDKAANILLPSDDYTEIKGQLAERPTVESHMIRYKYGPWDRKYYLVLAYLSGKNLVNISVKGKADSFELSATGQSLAINLQQVESFRAIVERCSIVGTLFGNRSGTWIKDFIYERFPEVVRTPMTHLIPSKWSNADSEVR